MNQEFTRRDLLLTMGTGIAAATAAPLLLGSRRAQAEQASIVAVEWGGPYIEVMTELTKKQNNVTVNWEQHAGGSAAILAKIKAGWPHPRYDVVASYDPVYASFLREQWYEPLSLDDIPALHEIPKTFLLKDDAGKIVNVPRSISGFFFGYRSDTVPFEIKTLDDLRDPRLKGQICWNDPISGSGVWLLPLALHGGGDERNLQPGWDFTKELAKSGNIGRVAQSEADFINSISTGETSVAFWDAGGWMGVAKNFPTVFLNKVPNDPVLKTYLFQEGWIILRSSEKKAAVLQYLDWMSQPEQNGTINEALGLAPAHPNAPVSERVKKWALRPEELDQFGHYPDWGYLSSHLDEVTQRFEKEIQPLL